MRFASSFLSTRARPPILHLDPSSTYSEETHVSREVTDIDDEKSLSAYLTEAASPPDAERPPPSRAVLLLPGARGWRDARTRRLADRIALYCLALVCIPDIHRGGAPMPLGQSPPTERVQSDVRSASLYLRADHRVGALALLGADSGGDSFILNSLAADAPAIGAAAGVALCCGATTASDKRRANELAALPQEDSNAAPLLLLFDKTGEGDDAAAASARSSLGLEEKSAGGGRDGGSMVMQFEGLGKAMGEAEEEEAEEVSFESEDALIMAEAFLNLHLARAEAARGSGGR